MSAQDGLGPQFTDFIAPKPLADWESPGPDAAGRPTPPRTPDSSTTGFLAVTGRSSAGSHQYRMQKTSKDVAKRVVTAANGRLVPDQHVANRMRPWELS